MARKATDDEFVDLYNLLEVPQDADATTIRKRVNALYLEAQQNLDHRNIKKRLKFQQMYELYLPQARHLLLDKARRAEYDRYLKAYHSGHLPPPSSLPPEKHPVDPTTEVSAGPEPAEGGVSFNFDDADTAIAEEPVDPEKQAAQREDMWAKWKTGLEHVLTDEIAEATGSQSTNVTAPTAEYAEYAEYAEEEYDEETYFDFDDTGAAQPQAARQRPPVDPTAIDLNDPEKIKEIEHQREVRRYALIRQAAQSAGLVWAWWAGTLFFFFSCVLFYMLDEYLTSSNNHPIDRSIFNGLALIGIMLLSIFVGYSASSFARQRIIDELSHLALPDLVRRTRKK